MSFIVRSIWRSRHARFTRSAGPASVDPKEGDRVERAVVVGAGLAGLKAALDFQASGVGVTLVEARRRIGGRTFSFTDPMHGTVLDNGQHVILGCCSAVRDLLRALGLGDAVTLVDPLRVPVFMNGAWSVLASVPRWGPLHLGAGILGYRHLTRAGRLTAFRAALSLLRGRRGPPDTFFRWLERQGHRADDIEALWNLLAISV